MTDISDLPPDERAASYRTLAADAQRQAEKSTSPRMREAYTLMATQWTKLAEEAASFAKKLRELG